MCIRDSGDAETMVLAGVAPIVPNVVDEPVRVAILPEHWTGWVGRPGLSGSRQGRDWSPRFTTRSLHVDDQPVEAGSTRPSLLSLCLLYTSRCV